MGLLLVIFGAGASYDSTADVRPGENNAPVHLRERVQYRPPLADHLLENRALFANILGKYEECHGVVGYLRNRAADQSVESVLTGLEAQVGQRPERRSQLAAIRFYLRDALWLCQQEWSKLTGGITNYKALLDRIALWKARHPQASLVTFNYDTLLEEALPVVGISIGEMEDYTRQDNVAVFKLHGSVDWHREVTLPPQLPLQLPAPEDMVAARWMIAETDLRPNPGSPKRIQGMNLRNREGNIGLFPAMAIPVTSKNVFECPDAQIEVLKARLPAVTKILIIGWRGQEQHFLRLLSDHLRPGKRGLQGLIVAGGLELAKEIGTRIKEVGIPVRFGYTDAGFSKLATGVELERFLQA